MDMFVIQLALLTAFHAHPENGLVVTLTLSGPPAFVKLPPFELSANEHVSPSAGSALSSARIPRGKDDLTVKPTDVIDIRQLLKEKKI